MCLAVHVFALRLPESSGCTGVGQNQGQSHVGFAFCAPRSSELTRQLFVVTLLVQLKFFSLEKYNKIILPWQKFDSGYIFANILL